LLAALGLLAAAAGAGERPALAGAGLSAALPSFGRRVGAHLRAAASVVPRRSSSRTVRLGLGAVALLGAVILLMPGGLGSRALGRVLLNVGTAELNRVTIPEGVPRAERARSLDRAVWLLEGAARLERIDPAVQRNLALALAARRDDVGARESLERARIVTLPADQRGQFQLGRAYVAAEAWPEAIRAWEAADAGPQLDRLGDRLLRARSHDQSIAAYGAAARAEPGLAEAYAGLARAARERGDDLGQMVTRFESLIARGGLNEYYGRIQVARAYREAGRPIDALESLRLAERVHRDPDLDLEQGAALTQSGRHEEAALLLRGVTDSRPQDANGWYWLGVAEARQGSYEAAIATARTGLAKLGPSRRVERGPLLAVIGDSLLGLGRAREALAAYEEGQTLTPGDRHLAEGAERARLALAGSPDGQP
jgi:tetratricopeptide (TPR) repeat protein